MNTNRWAALSFAVTALAAGSARAGGFEILEQGAVGASMAGAGAAIADDAAAVFYNPAGLVHYPGAGVIVGSHLALASASAKLGDTTSSTYTRETEDLFIPYLFAGVHLGRRVAVGLGLYSQFGDALNWDHPETFPGRFIASAASLKSFTINPSFALHPVQGFSVAVGVDVVLGSAIIERSIQLGDAEAVGRIGGSAVGLGFNLGVLVDVLPKHKMTLGLTYRSGVDLDFDLKAHFTGVPVELQGQLFDQPAKTSIRLPDNITIGLAARPTPGLVIDLDLHYTQWSSFRALVVEFPTSSTPSLRADQSWRDVVSLRLGAQYRCKCNIAYRLGIGYDWTPIPTETLSPTVPGQDRVLLSAGVGYAWHGFGVDLAYLAALGADRTSTLPDYPARYSTTIQLLSLALSYHL